MEPSTKMASRTLSSLCILAVAVLELAAGLTHGGVKVHPSQDGGLSVLYGDSTWLVSLPPYLHTLGRRYSAENASLKLIGQYTQRGSDVHGRWSSAVNKYSADGVLFETSYKLYENVSMVIFEQRFPDGAPGTSLGAPNRALSGYPRLVVGGQSADLDLGYLNYGGMFVGDTTKWMGRWGRLTYNLRDGVPGGPLALFDRSGRAAIVSSYSQFMVNLHEHDAVFGGALAYGVMGSVRSIPRGYSLQNIVYFSDHGINRAFEGWGEVLRRQYGRHDKFVQSDLAVNYLGYWTDNGAYYYSVTEQNKTYEETILDVQQYAQNMGIPYRYVQFDSWWYVDGPYGGVLKWEDRPGIFPSGMQSVYNKTGWPVVAHNRWWSSVTPYRKKFRFLTEALKSAPMDVKFWDWLFTKSKLWGLITYEQDWLDAELLGLEGLQEDVHSARDWLMLMGAGAEHTGITLQYCMAFPRHALQALEIPTVTQIRVTDDYAPGKDDWKLGISSILAHALRIAPYKDSFWTTTDQPGNPYGLSETHPALHAVASVLSTGPVGPADAIGKTNVSLLMRCCNKEGLLLKPDKPVTATDTQIMQAAFGASGPVGELWSTYTVVSGWSFGVILSAAMAPGAAFNVTPHTAGLGHIIPRASVVFADVPRGDPPRAQRFDGDHPVLLRDCTNTAFCLYHTAPVIALRSGDELVLYGELAKWVPMSAKRVRAIDVAGNDVTVTLAGAEGEVVTFWYRLGSRTSAVRCVVPARGSTVLSVRRHECV